MPFGYGRPHNMIPYVAAHCHPQPRWLPVKTLPGQTYTHTRYTDIDMLCKESTELTWYIHYR